MNFFKISTLSFLLIAVNFFASAQTSKIIEEMEAQYKECQRAKPDSTVCSRIFLNQMDSMQNVIFEKIRSQLSADEKTGFMKEQVSWSEKKGKYFKKEDENFVYNLKEGNWTKDMIRFTYQDKAAFLLKRIKELLKQLKE
ncbi:MAG: hypothetical protein U0U67_13650 [Chitinophagales bacterium]